MLAIENVVRYFRAKVAIDRVSAQFVPRSINVLLGANGAGKSTLLKLILGELAYAQGSIQLDGETIRPNRTKVRKRIMMLEVPTKRDLKVSDLILDVIDDYGLQRESLPDEAAELFERFNLVGCYRKTWAALSKGQRYKILLIGLFLARPHVWLLDEPYSCGLDANGLDVLNAEMQRHRDSGGIVIFSSQWPEQAQKLADRFVVLDEGRLAWQGSANESPSAELIASASPALTAVLEQVKST